MNIFLTIIGGILLLICGFIRLVTHAAIKSPENWEDFITHAEDLPVPEDVAYNLIYKISFWSGILAIVGFLTLAGGILLTIF